MPDDRPDKQSMPDEQTRSTSVLLIAHGSRRQAANADLVELARAIRARDLYQSVETSYLEVTEPTIPQGARRLIDQGARQVLMLPYFLSAGAHVVEDLQRHRRELSDKFPGVSFLLCPPLGLHPLLIEVVFERLREGRREG